MSTVSKSSKPEAVKPEAAKRVLKEQALKHWKENEKRLKAMNWRKWHRIGYDARQYELFNTSSDYAPQINGKHCPFCLHYSESCYVSTDYTYDRGRITRDSCPLYNGDTGRGECCKEWKCVRDALLYPTTKKAAMAAVKAMIERLEALKDE